MTYPPGGSSGTGRDSYAQGALQYAASDIVYYSQDGGYLQEAESQHPFQYVTVSAGGLAFMYNIVINGQRWTGLNLTSKEACQIFTGQLTTWNQLASTPGDSALASVDQPIHPVVRSDPAGESYVFSQYCIAVDDSDWQTFQNFVDGAGKGANDSDGWQGDADMSAGKPVENWPPVLSQSSSFTDTAIPENGATETVDAVENPNNGFSIGYMAASYALTAGYPMASVQNPAGNFVQPNANTVQIALSYAVFNGQTFNLSFTGRNPDAYFPSTYSYIIAPTTTNTPTSAGADATLAQFLCYAVGAGQQDAPRLLYAPLSQQVTQLSINAINSIPYPGGQASKLVPNCGVGGPAPPVSAPGVVSPLQLSPGEGGSTGTSSGGPTATTAPSATTAPGSVTATTVAGSGVNPSAVGSSVAHPTGTSATGQSVTTATGTQPCATTTTSTTSTTSTTTSTLPKRSSKTRAGREERDTTTAAPGKASTTTTTIAPDKNGTTTTTGPDKAGTTTTAPGKGAITPGKGVTTTSSTSSSTTSTTLCSSSGSAKAGAVGTGLSGAAGSNGLAIGQAAGTPTSVQLDSTPASSSETNSQAYWYLLVGAVVCAVGVGAVELRRRPAR